MLFNKHSNLVGTHAFLGASNYHWINYEDDKLDRAFRLSEAARKGIALHEFAKDAIRLGIKLPDDPLTMNQYVNDAIGFRMIPEQVLVYSENCYGTADTIGFSRKKNKLRIHDYKSGVTKTSENQLYVYNALFCLEYDYKPHEIESELRIYQNNETRIYEADPDFTAHIMDKIVSFDKRIKALKAEMDF